VDLAERLAETVRRHRQEAGLNQRDMARKLGISQATLARLEGGAQNTNLKVIEKLCRALRCDVGELFGGAVKARRR
jgi:transcriptional regulator with XRE-family HTH domain